MSDVYTKLFQAQLPFRIQVLGRDVTWLKSRENKLTADVGDKGDVEAIQSAFQRWQSRRAIHSYGPAEGENYQQMERRLMKRETISLFLKFLFKMPIFPRLFLFKPPTTFVDFPARALAINEAILTWDAITNWKAKPNGKLYFSYSCAGYRIQPGDVLHDLVLTSPDVLSKFLCNSSTSEPTGCCSMHSRSNVRTIFNYYPFFEAEGVRELSFPN